MSNSQDQGCNCGPKSNRFENHTYEVPVTYEPEEVLKDTEVSSGPHGIQRSQNQKKCPTRFAFLHLNLTNEVINVSGNLVIHEDSCNLLVIWGKGPGQGRRFHGGTNMSVTFPVQPGWTLVARCERGEENLCNWSFTQTSP